MRRHRAHVAVAVLGTFVALLLFLSAAPALAAEESGRVGVSSTQIAVLVVTCVAFAGAIFAGRRAMHASPESDMPFHENLIGIDLLATRPPSGFEPKIVGAFETVYLVILLLYALFDRAFAWMHVPGTPLFVGEITLALGLLALMSTRVPMLAAIRRSASLKILLAWMVWGLLFLVIQVPGYGIDAIRDSALWYYGVTALLTVFLFLSDPTRFGRWADTFQRAIPIVLLWMPIAMVLATIFGETAPYVPDSDVSLFVHRFGNVAVVAAIILGFIWLVDRERGRFSTNQRVIYTVLAALIVLVAAFQNRGGLVSAAVGILLMLLFMHGRRTELVLVMAGVVVGLVVIAVVSDVRIPIQGGREISAAQMADNITSIIDPSSGDARQTETTQWRLDLWATVVDDVTTESPIAGFGPGPNLGLRYGVATDEDLPLRNPHNSHVGILARMGWIGVGLWVVLWLVWTVRLLQLRMWLRQGGRSVEAGLAAWIFVSIMMIQVNAIFDPTLEGPQVAFWLWLFFGLGVSMELIYGGLGVPRLNRAFAAEANEPTPMLPSSELAQP